jgi:hypothetical protein
VSARRTSVGCIDGRCPSLVLDIADMQRYICSTSRDNPDTIYGSSKYEIEALNDVHRDGCDPPCDSYQEHLSTTRFIVATTGRTRVFEAWWVQNERLIRLGSRDLSLR